MKVKGEHQLCNPSVHQSIKRIAAKCVFTFLFLIPYSIFLIISYVELTLIVNL